ncbi:MAG: hypothetical protein RLP09_13700 [Sandaracinaceae bacterium]
MPSERARRRLVLALIALAALYLVAHAVASSFVLGALWDWRVFEGAWYDHAWELELVHQARLGNWSGRDFHYPRGPLWQWIAWLGSRPWADFDGPRTLAGLDLCFHILALITLGWIVWRRVAGTWRRLAVLCVLGSVHYAVGVPSFRALLSTVLVLVYLNPEDDAPSWRRGFACAAVLTTGLLISFDRFGLGAVSLAAMFTAELALARLEHAPLQVPWRRGVRTAGAILASLLVVALIGAALGADPVEYVVGQRRIASGYATGMRSEWQVGVPPINVLAFFVVGAGLFVVGARARWSRPSLVWIAGALPSALFGVVTADQGHVFMAILPLIVVLTLVAARAADASWLRLSSGVLAAAALLGWLGTYPGFFSPHPRVFADAWAVLAGDKRPDRGFRSDHGRAVAWARAIVAAERPRCMSISPSLGVVHAFAEIPGPSQLGLRWNEPLQRQLAERIREADCPIHLHSFISFDDIGGSWFLGPDFLAIAERYRFDERVGIGVVAMRRRETSAPAREVAIATASDAVTHLVSLPSELRIPLSRRVRGDSILRLRYALETPLWRAQLGGVPWVEWRFEREGAPIGEWEPLHHLRRGEGEVLLSPDAEAVEHRWILERPVDRERFADALQLRFRPRGATTAAEVGFATLALTELRPPPLTRPPETPSCRESVDLLEEIRAGRSFARMTSPGLSQHHFNLEPNPYPVPLAEVFFRLRPCPGACLRARLGVAAEATESDGVDFQFHSIRGVERVLLEELHVPAGGEERAVELPLDRWPERSQLLRIGTETGEGESSDYAFVARPSVGPCSARSWLGEAISRGDATVEAGEARVEGADIVTGEGVTRVAYPVFVIDSTCIGMGASAASPVHARVMVSLRVDGLEQVVRRHYGTLGPTPVALVDGLHDWGGRETTLVVEAESDSPVRLWGPNLYRCPE